MEWPEEDRAKALAFAIEKNNKCGLCGTAEWEWEEDKRAYTPVESLCMGCYLKSQLEDESGHQPGTTIKLIPTHSTENEKRLLSQKRAYLRSRER